MSENSEYNNIDYSKASEMVEKKEKIPLEIWVEHFTRPTKEQNGLLKKIFEKERSNISMKYIFLDQSQIMGRTLQMLGIPNICGEISKTFLKQYKKSRNKPNFFEKQNKRCLKKSVKGKSIGKSVSKVAGEFKQTTPRYPPVAKRWSDAALKKFQTRMNEEVKENNQLKHIQSYTSYKTNRLKSEKPESCKDITTEPQIPLAPKSIAGKIESVGEKNKNNVGSTNFQKTVPNDGDLSSDKSFERSSVQPTTIKNPTRKLPDNVDSNETDEVSELWSTTAIIHNTENENTALGEKRSKKNIKKSVTFKNELCSFISPTPQSSNASFGKYENSKKEHTLTESEQLFDELVLKTKNCNLLPSDTVQENKDMTPNTHHMSTENEEKENSSEIKLNQLPLTKSVHSENKHKDSSSDSNLIQLSPTEYLNNSLESTSYISESFTTNQDYHENSITNKEARLNSDPNIETTRVSSSLDLNVQDENVSIQSISNEHSLGVSEEKNKENKENLPQDIHFLKEEEEKSVSNMVEKCSLSEPAIVAQNQLPKFGSNPTDIVVEETPSPLEASPSSYVKVADWFLRKDCILEDAKFGDGLLQNHPQEKSKCLEATNIKNGYDKTVMNEEFEEDYFTMSPVDKENLFHQPDNKLDDSQNIEIATPTTTTTYNQAKETSKSSKKIDQRENQCLNFDFAEPKMLSQLTSEKSHEYPESCSDSDRDYISDISELNSQDIGFTPSITNHKDESNKQIVHTNVSDIPCSLQNSTLKGDNEIKADVNIQETKILRNEIEENVINQVEEFELVSPLVFEEAMGSLGNSNIESVSKPNVSSPQMNKIASDDMSTPFSTAKIVPGKSVKKDTEITKAPLKNKKETVKIPIQMKKSDLDIGSSVSTDITNIRACKDLFKTKSEEYNSIANENILKSKLKFCVAANSFKIEKYTYLDEGNNDEGNGLEACINNCETTPLKENKTTVSTEIDVTDKVENSADSASNCGMVPSEINKSNIKNATVTNKKTVVDQNSSSFEDKLVGLIGRVNLSTNTFSQSCINVDEERTHFCDPNFTKESYENLSEVSDDYFQNSPPNKLLINKEGQDKKIRNKGTFEISENPSQRNDKYSDTSEIEENIHQECVLDQLERNALHTRENGLQSHEIMTNNNLQENFRRQIICSSSLKIPVPVLQEATKSEGSLLDSQEYYSLSNDTKNKRGVLNLHMSDPFLSSAENEDSLDFQENDLFLSGTPNKGSQKCESLLNETNIERDLLKIQENDPLLFSTDEERSILLSQKSGSLSDDINNERGLPDSQEYDTNSHDKDDRKDLPNSQEYDTLSGDIDNEQDLLDKQKCDSFSDGTSKQQVEDGQLNDFHINNAQKSGESIVLSTEMNHKLKIINIDKSENCVDGKEIFKISKEENICLEAQKTENPDSKLKQANTDKNQLNANRSVEHDMRFAKSGIIKVDKKTINNPVDIKLSNKKPPIKTIQEKFKNEKNLQGFSKDLHDKENIEKNHCDETNNRTKRFSTKRLQISNKRILKEQDKALYKETKKCKSEVLSVSNFNNNFENKNSLLRTDIPGNVQQSESFCDSSSQNEESHRTKSSVVTANNAHKLLSTKSPIKIQSNQSFKCSPKSKSLIFATTLKIPCINSHRASPKMMSTSPNNIAFEIHRARAEGSSTNKTKNIKNRPKYVSTVPVPLTKEQNFYRKEERVDNIEANITNIRDEEIGLPSSENYSKDTPVTEDFVEDTQQFQLEDSSISSFESEGLGSENDIPPCGDISGFNYYKNSFQLSSNYFKERFPLTNETQETQGFEQPPYKKPKQTFSVSNDANNRETSIDMSTFSSIDSFSSFEEEGEAPGNFTDVLTYYDYNKFEPKTRSIMSDTKSGSNLTSPLRTESEYPSMSDGDDGDDFVLNSPTENNIGSSYSIFNSRTEGGEFDYMFDDSN